MLKRMATRKFIITGAALFALLLIYLIPKNSNNVLQESLNQNLEYVNKDVARRIVDFISGGVYALDGYIQKVSNSIFLVAPSNYEITNEMAREEMKSKLSVSWLKNNGVN